MSVGMAIVNLIVFILACIKALFARLRIEQMVTMCLKWLAPIAMVQLLIALELKFVGGCQVFLDAPS